MGEHILFPFTLQVSFHHLNHDHIRDRTLSKLKETFTQRIQFAPLYELMLSCIQYTDILAFTAAYLIAAPFQEQAILVYIDDDNAMLEVDDKQQHFRCNGTKQIGTNPPSKQYWVYYLLPRAAHKFPFTLQDET